MNKLLIVDDNEDIRTQLKWGLRKEYQLFFAEDRGHAMNVIRKHSPNIVLLDLGLPPDADGVDEGFLCLREILGTVPGTRIIVITGKAERIHALRAVSLGAFDYYQKPLDLEELRVVIRRAFHVATLEKENRDLHQALESKATQTDGMLGQSPRMQQVFATIRKVASADAAVLVVGESGVGKEVVARAIHTMSQRKDEPFIPINCGAIPDTLLESELFGHERGAFTGAHAQVPGKVEYSNNGTLFLDEIGEIPVHLQVKLLRFLQDKTIQRVGGRETITVNTRIIAATNTDLERAIREGKFREDLFYRLSVVTIPIPALRDRGEDIMLLATYFLKRYKDLYGKRLRGFSAAAMDRIESHAWPGNVRELENKVQRAVILAEGPLIEPGDLGLPLDEETPQQPAVLNTLREARRRIERDMVSLALDRNKGNMAKAAAELGVSRPTLYDLMKKNNIYVELNTAHEQDPEPEQEPET